MRYFAVLVTLGLRVMFVRSDRVSANCELIPDSYEAAIYSVDIPMIERNVSADELKIGVGTVPKKFLSLVITELYDQAKSQGKALAKRIRASGRKLRNEIEAIEERGCGGSLDARLVELTNELRTFLDCQPGPILAQRPRYMLLPLAPFKVVPGCEPRNIVDLFTKFGNLVDHDFACTYAIADTLFRAGWLQARKTFETFHDQIRNQLLNGPMTKAAKTAVRAAYEKLDVVEKNSSWRTFYDFKYVADRVLALPERYYDTPAIYSTYL